MVVETVDFVGFADFDFADLAVPAAPAALVDLMIVGLVEQLDSPGSWPDWFESLEELDEAVDQLVGGFAEFVDQSAEFAVEIVNQIAEPAALFDSFENFAELDLGRFVVEMLLIGLHFGSPGQAAAEDFQVPGQAQYP